MSAWMIIPCLFAYMFIGVLFTALLCTIKELENDEDDILVVILWPLFLVIGLIGSLILLVNKGTSYFTYLFTKYLTK